MKLTESQIAHILCVPQHTANNRMQGRGSYTKDEQQDLNKITRLMESTHDKYDRKRR